jgi:AcrR family transcriptional regulator
MRAESEQTRDRMIRTALELFTEHGYEGASIQMIATAMGLSKAAVSYHFRTKEDLLAAVAEPAFTDLQRFLDEAEAEPGRAARWRMAVRGYVSLLVKHRGLLTLLEQDPIAAASPVVSEKMERFAERIRLLFGEESMTPEEQVYLAVALGGLRNAAAWFPAFSDTELNQYLLSAAERILGRTAPRARR